MPCCFTSQGVHSIYCDSFMSSIADNMSALAGCDRGESSIFLCIVVLLDSFTRFCLEVYASQPWCTSDKRLPSKSFKYMMKSVGPRTDP